MNSQTYITCYKKSAADTIGYLFLQSKGRKNRKKKALGIAIKYSHFKNYWNEKDQRFRSGMEHYKLLNEKIEKAFEENTKETGEIKETIKIVKQSFLSYWDRQIELIPNQGSKGKHVVVKKKLETYLQSIKKPDINFADLTPEFIADLHYQFKTDRALTTSSVNSYMKLINNVVKIRTNIFTLNELKKHIRRSVKDYIKRRNEQEYYEGKENETINYITFFETTKDFFNSQHTNKIVDTNFYAGIHFHLFITGVNENYINELKYLIEHQKNKIGCISKINSVKAEKLDFDFKTYHVKQMMFGYSPQLILKNYL